MSNSIESRILEAAISLFGERGYAAISITDLEKKAEVTRSTLFQWFGSKENLFEQALQEAVKRFLNPGDFALTLFENRKKQQLPALLRTAVENWYSAMVPETARLLVHACFTGNKKWRDLALAPIERMIELLTTGMERGVEKQSGFEASAAAK